MQKCRDYIAQVESLFPDSRAVALHHLLPDILDDSIPKEREMALRWGRELIATCDLVCVCGGVLSDGMAQEVDFALCKIIPVAIMDEPLYRTILTFNPDKYHTYDSLLIRHDDMYAVGPADYFRESNLLRDDAISMSLLAKKSADHLSPPGTADPERLLRSEPHPGDHLYHV